MQLDPPAVPHFPNGLQSYEQRYQNEFNNILRLYLQRLNQTVDAILAPPLGGKFLYAPYGAFYDTSSQHDGSTTIPYAIRLNSTEFSNGISVSARTVEAVGSIGPASTTMTITAINAGRFYPGMILSGTGVTAGSYVYLQLSSTAPVFVSHSFVSGGAIGATTVVLNSVTGIEERQFVSGTGVPANTRVVNVNSLTNTVTLSAAFTLQAAGSYNFRQWGYQGTYSVSPSQTVGAGTVISGLSNSKIAVDQAGIYNVQFSFQFSNTAAQDYDVDIWFKKNDISIADSNSIFTVPSKHGSTNGKTIAAINYPVELIPGDELEIIWHTQSSTVFIENIPAQIAPIRPASPSAIVTVTFVSNIV